MAILGPEIGYVEKSYLEALAFEILSQFPVSVHQFSNLKRVKKLGKKLKQLTQLKPFENDT